MATRHPSFFALVLTCAMGSPCLIAENVGPKCADRFNYQSNFAGGNSSWYTLGTKDGKAYYRLLAPGSGTASSIGPWVPDWNHVGDNVTYGVGSLHLIAFAWLHDFYEKYRRGAADGDLGQGILGSCVDLSNATVTTKVTTKGFRPNGGRLIFWFQNVIDAVDCNPTAANNCRVTVNYGFNRSVRMNDQNTIKLTNQIGDWTCFGASNKGNRYPDRPGAAGYGCAANQKNFEQAISSVALDFGFIFILARKAPPANSPLLVLPSGTITFEDISIASP